MIINTSTTIITFLMVFLIQNTQNRDNDVLHLKIDELLRVTKDAQNSLLNLDDFTQKDLRALRKKYEAMGGNHDLDAPLPMAGADQRV
ncbi:low affinity Fe/Cu permease [Pseudomonas sp. PvP027]|nr:low affinity Fe/Cu permease [Pseudomonas sp. PvP027]